MPNSFRNNLDAGFQRSVRYRVGEGANIWGNPMNALAERLDKMEMSEEVAAALREVFEEAGQIARDSWAAQEYWRKG